MKDGENDKAEKLDHECKAVFEACTACIVAIADSCDHSTDPIVGEDHQIKLAHSMEVFICYRPWKMVGLIVNEFVASNEQPATTKVMEQDYNLAKGCNCIRHHPLVMLIIKS